MDREIDPSEQLYRIRLRTLRGSIVLLVAFILLSLSWVSIHVYDVEWVVVEVDDSSITCCPSIAETPSGSLVMAYGTTEGLVLATLEDGDWAFSSIMGSEQPEGTLSVSATALAVDDDGGVHVATMTYWPEVGLLGTSRLIYSEQTASGWENTIVDEDVWTRSVSIAVDSHSRTHISYAKNSGAYYIRNITYATDSTGEWVAYDISSQNRYLSWNGNVVSSICVDGTDRPHLACLSGYLASYATNLTGTPIVVPLCWGDPGAADYTYPSRPAIWTDLQDVVHVLCINQHQDTVDAPVTQTVVHYSVQGSAGSYENTTISSDIDFSWDTTQVVTGPDGQIRVFCSASYGVNLITMTGDGKASYETVFSIAGWDWEIRSQWKSGLSAVLRSGGDIVISKPYGSLGYLTDSFTFSERLSAGVVPIQQSVLVLTVVTVVVAMSVIFARRSFIEEAKWRK